MNNSSINWSKNEFKAYVYLYATQSNYIESKEEKKFLLTNVNRFVLYKMRQVIKKDKDLKRIQKIIRFLKTSQLSTEEYKNLVRKVKLLLEVDGLFDVMERHFYQALKRNVLAKAS